MSTTSPELAAATLSGLMAAAVDLAILHGEGEIAAGNIVSDVDLVTGAPLGVLLRGPLRSVLEERGVFPVMVWPYDVSGTVTVFFTNIDGSEGVQIDALHDPGGLGKFGIRSGALLENSAPGEQWPAVQPPYSLLYQVRKRHWKRQFERLNSDVEALRRFSRNEIEDAVAQTFEPTTQRVVLDLIAGMDPRKLPRVTTRYRARNLERRMRRLTASVGAWVEFCGPGASEAATTATHRFSRFLPLCRNENRPHVLGSAWWISRVVPVRLRPGLFVGVGEGRERPRPDITIPVIEDAVPDAMRRLVGAMRDRALR